MGSKRARTGQRLKRTKAVSSMYASSGASPNQSSAARPFWTAQPWYLGAGVSGELMWAAGWGRCALDGVVGEVLGEGLAVEDVAVVVLLEHAHEGGELGGRGERHGGGQDGEAEELRGRRGGGG